MKDATNFNPHSPPNIEEIYREIYETRLTFIRLLITWWFGRIFWWVTCFSSSSSKAKLLFLVRKRASAFEGNCCRSLLLVLLLASRALLEAWCNKTESRNLVGAQQQKLRVYQAVARSWRTWRGPKRNSEKQVSWWGGWREEKHHLGIKELDENRKCDIKTLMKDKLAYPVHYVTKITSKT